MNTFGGIMIAEDMPALLCRLLREMAAQVEQATRALNVDDPAYPVSVTLTAKLDTIKLTVGWEWPEDNGAPAMIGGQPVDDAPVGDAPVGNPIL